MAKATSNRNKSQKQGKSGDKPKRNLYKEVTDNIVKALRTGKAPWAETGGAKPFNASTGEAYHGINVLSLWHAQCGAGYPTSAWLTYKQAEAVGGQVRKGEHGVLCVKYSVFEKKEMVNGIEELQRIPYLNPFTLFNVAQVDNLPEKYTGPRCIDGGPEQLEALLRAQQATIVPSLDVTGYDVHGDFIRLPSAEMYPDRTAELAATAHSYVAWTGAANRCNRDVSEALAALAYEELVSELGGAFLCAEHGIRNSVHHAEYVEGWITMLEQDNRVLFKVAKQAQAAVTWLHANAAALTPEEPALLAA